jgi:hypothetical protein
MADDRADFARGSGLLWSLFVLIVRSGRPFALPLEPWRASFDCQVRFASFRFCLLSFSFSWLDTQ